MAEAAAAAAALRREWSNCAKGMPTFRADRQKGESFRQFRQQWTMWKELNQLDQWSPIEQQKLGLATCLKDAAGRALLLHGPGSATYAAAATTEEYMNVLQGVFQPAAESSMARQDFQSRKQGPQEAITEYLADKYGLYNMSVANMAERNFAYLRQMTLAGIYSNWVKAEVIRANPMNEDALQNACVTAVGQARETYSLGCNVVPNLDGLAGTSIPNRYAQNAVEDMDIGKMEETRTCHRCQAKGHLIANCPKKADRARGNGGRSAGGSGRGSQRGNDKVIPICHYCKKEGHKRPECRTLKRDEAEGRVDPRPKGRRTGVKKTDEDGDHDSEDESGSEDEDPDAGGASGLSAVYDPVFRV